MSCMIALLVDRERNSTPIIARKLRIGGGCGRKVQFCRDLSLMDLDG